MNTRILLIALAMQLFAGPSMAEVNIDQLVKVTRSGLVYNRSTNTFDTVVTVKNISTTPIAAPLVLAVSNISASSVSLQEIAGFLGLGKPYVDAPLPRPFLEPNESAQFILKFANALRTAFTFRLNIYNELTQDKRGVLLPGKPESLAINTTYHLADNWGVPESEITEVGNTEVARTLIEIWFKEDAVLSDINLLIQSIGGKIISMSKDLPIVLVRVPDPGSVESLEDIIDQLNANPDVEHAALAIAPSSNQLPGLPDNFSASDKDNDHHLAVRAHAAWNARAAGRVSPLVLIADRFGRGAPDANYFSATFANASDFYTVGIRYSRNQSIQEALQGNHGYKVTSIIAGNFPSLTGRVYGIYPPYPVPVIIGAVDEFRGIVAAAGQGLREPELTRFLWQHFEQGIIDRIQLNSGRNVIVNTSQKFDFCDDSTMPDSRFCTAAEIDWYARTWSRKLTAANLINKFVHATGAGNIGIRPVVGTNADQQFGKQARYASPFAAAALQNTFVVDNWIGTGGDTSTFKPSCLSAKSYYGGNIAGIGGEDIGVTRQDGGWEEVSG